jgi:hypothetical protein
LPSRCYVMVQSGTVGRRTRSAQTTLNVRSPSSWHADRDRRGDPPGLAPSAVPCSKLGPALVDFSPRAAVEQIANIAAAADGAISDGAKMLSGGGSAQQLCACEGGAQIQRRRLGRGRLCGLLNTRRRNCPSRVQPRLTFELNELLHRIRLVSAPEGTRSSLPHVGAAATSRRGELRPWTKRS